MVKIFKRRWKRMVVIGCAAVLLDATLYINRDTLISYGAMKLVAAQVEDVDPDTLTLDDFRDIPGVTQEYVNAFKLFLKCRGGDKGKPTYADAAAAFGKIAAATGNPEIKLRSFYMVTFSYFLQGDIDEAYESGKYVLALSKQLYSDDSRIIKLGEVVSAINKREIKDIEELKAEFSDAEAGGDSEDFYLLAEGQRQLQEFRFRFMKLTQRKQ